MAAARDQAARIIRAEAEEGETGHDAPAQLPTHVAEEAKRRPAEQPATDEPAAPPADSAEFLPRPNPASANSS